MRDKKSDLNAALKASKSQKRPRNTLGLISGVLGDMVGSYKRKKFNERISLKDPTLRSIYQEIIGYDPAVDKVKPEKVKVHKSQIIHFLRKKYGPRAISKIMSVFKFLNTSTYEEYVQVI